MYQPHEIFNCDWTSFDPERMGREVGVRPGVSGDAVVGAGGGETRSANARISHTARRCASRAATLVRTMNAHTFPHSFSIPSLLPRRASGLRSGRRRRACTASRKATTSPWRFVAPCQAPSSHRCGLFPLRQADPSSATLSRGARTVCTRRLPMAGRMSRPSSSSLLISFAT